MEENTEPVSNYKPNLTREQVKELKIQGLLDLIQSTLEKLADITEDERITFVYSYILLDNKSEKMVSTKYGGVGTPERCLALSQMLNEHLLEDITAQVLHIEHRDNGQDETEIPS